MGKKLFYAFLALIVASTAFVIFYVQSSQFARLVRNRFIYQIENEFGIKIEFDRIKIKALPPGIALVDLKVKNIEKTNKLKLPTDSEFSANEVGITFRTLQTFGKKLVVNKIYLNGLSLKLNLEVSSDNSNFSLDKNIVSYLSKPIKIYLDSGLELDIKQLELRDSSVDVNIKSNNNFKKFFIEKIKFFALRPEKKLYTSVIDLENVSWKSPKSIDFFNSLRGNFEIGENIIRLLSFDITKEEMNFHIGGVLEGDLSKPEKLKNQLRIIGRSSANGISQWIPEIGKTRGVWSLETQILGTFLEPILKGSLDISEFAYEQWNFDKLSSRFEYSKEKVNFEEIVIGKNNGNVTITNAVFPIKEKHIEEKILIKLNNANLHDYTGSFKKEINNLELVANGEIPTEIKIDISKNNSVALNYLKVYPNLEIKELELNNLDYAKTRKKHVILEPKDFKVIGQVQWFDHKLTIDNSQINFNGEVIDVNGTIDAKNGWNLKGVTNQFDLGKNIQTIAENKIQGIGKVTTIVKGTTRNIFLNFDFDLSNAEYVNLDAGSLKGSATYDDKESKLILNGIKGRKISGEYNLDGLIDLSDDDGINLKAKFIDVSPEDLFTIFKKQIEKIDWIPYGITGNITGNVFLGGKYTDPEKTFDLKGKIFGKKIVYKNEIFSDFETDISLKKGVYSAENIKIKKYNATIFGNVSYSTSDYLQYNYFIEHAKLRDIDLIAKSGIPLNGVFVSSGNGRGPTDKLVSRAELKIDSAHMGGINLPPIFLHLGSDAEAIIFNSFFGDNNTRVNLRVSRSEKKNSDLEILFGNNNYSFLFCAINNQYCGEKITNLFMNGHVRSSWKGKNWEKMSGLVELERLMLNSPDFNFQNSKPLNFAINNGLFNIPSVNFTGTESNFNIEALGNISADNFGARADGNIGMQILALVAPFIKKSSGTSKAEIVYNSKNNIINMSGKIDIKNAEISLNGITPNLENLNGQILLHKNRLRLEGFEGQIGQGKAVFDGNIDLNSSYFPTMNLAVMLQDNKVKFDPLNFAEIERGRITFTGSEPPYNLEGKVKFKRVLMKKNFEVSKSSSFKTSKYLPEDFFKKISLYSLKIEAFADKGIFIQNDLLDAEFKGKMTLLNNFTMPQILGEAELVKGKLFFGNIPFDLDYAVLKQENLEELLPKFSVGGLATVNAYKINLFARGTASDPKITLNASPPLPQEDILSLLAFGYIERNDSQIRADDKAAVTYTEVGSILLDQLRINKDLKSKGLNVRVVPSVVQKEANIIRPRSVPETALTKVLVGTQVAKNVDASLGTSVGSSQSQQFDVNVEYHLNDKVSVQSVYEQEPGADPGETKTSFGGDLKFKWGFK